MRKIVDNTGAIIIWTVLFGLLGTIIFIKGVVVETAEKLNAVRQDEVPSCSERSCPLPPRFGNKGTLGHEPEPNRSN